MCTVTLGRVILAVFSDCLSLSLISLLSCLLHLVLHPYQGDSTNYKPNVLLFFYNALRHKFLSRRIQLNVKKDSFGGQSLRIYLHASSQLSLSLVLSGELARLWFSLLLLIIKSSYFLECFQALPSSVPLFLIKSVPLWSVGVLFLMNFLSAIISESLLDNTLSVVQGSSLWSSHSWVETPLSEQQR